MLFYEACSLVLCLIVSVLYHSAGEDEGVCDRCGGAAFFDTAHRAGCSAASVINKAPKAYAFMALVRPTGFEPTTFRVGVSISAFYTVSYCAANP